MKRFASNYLLLPNIGYFRQQVIETGEDHSVIKIFPLIDEIESVEWMPGLIVLLTSLQKRSIEAASANCPILNFNAPKIAVQFLQQCPSFFNDYIAHEGYSLFPYLFHPFDFTTMQPVAETQHRPLL